MVALGRRILAGLLLIPPMTPIGIAVWYWARRAEKKTEVQQKQLEELKNAN